MKYLSIILLSFIIISCQKVTTNEKYFHFSSDSTISDKNGIPKDSSTLYFHKKLFYDTTKFLISKNDTFEFRSYANIDTIIKYSNLNKDSIYISDSVIIEDASGIAEILSYSLYKMKEPVLRNYYLKKEIYRLIIDRSLSKFFIINIEKDKDGIFVETKGLNRKIGYPFAKYPEFSPELIFLPQGKKTLSKNEIEKYRQNYDSIAKEFNNTDYYADSLMYKKITEEQWNQLLYKLNKIKFWDSYYWTCGQCLQIDGSRWILEGHNKNGYQIIEELNPPFDDENDQGYADLFRYIISICGMEMDKFRFY